MHFITCHYFNFLEIQIYLFIHLYEMFIFMRLLVYFNFLKTTTLEKKKKFKIALRTKGPTKK